MIIQLARAKNEHGEIKHFGEVGLIHGAACKN
jgi:hypothetical protein